MPKSASLAAPAPPPDPPADDPVAADEADLLAASIARVAHRLALLDELAEMGMKLSRRLTERALAEEPAPTGAPAGEPPPPDTEDRLGKLSRSVRLTLDLAGRLEETLRALRAGEATVRAARRQEGEARAFHARRRRDAAARDKVAEQVAMVIFSESESEGETSDLLDALEERLNDDTIYIDVEDQPLREMVERLCGDLGLAPDWSRWTDDGWPQPPRDVFKTREPWSPFNRVSRKPILT
jgi:vacuolar-type H+-ATPase subunit I/STV1